MLVFFEFVSIVADTPHLRQSLLLELQNMESRFSLAAAPRYFPPLARTLHPHPRSDSTCYLQLEKACSEWTIQVLHRLANQQIVHFETLPCGLHRDDVKVVDRECILSCMKGSAPQIRLRCQSPDLALQ